MPGTCNGRTLGSFFIAIIFALMVLLPQETWAQAFKAGQVIEYRVRGAYPEVWERGTILRELEGGKQYLIRQKPSQFYPEGLEYAYSPNDLRTAKDAKPLEPVTGKTTPTTAPTPIPAPAPAPKPATTETPRTAPAPAVQGHGLLTKAEVIAYAKQIFGPGDAFANPQRDALLNQIRDLIKTRGVSFEMDTDFRIR
ncbi:MAG TPA: hypothetical protein VGH19_08985 [Verrucomicrobiae bacterium]